MALAARGVTPVAAPTLKNEPLIMGASMSESRLRSCRKGRLRVHAVVMTSVALVLGLVSAVPVLAQQQGAPRAPAAGALPSIEEKTAGMRKLDGFFPLYWDDVAGQLWMEIPRFDVEVLHIAGLAAGLGSNDIGLDRGQLSSSNLVEFERVGPRVLLVQPNYRYRALSDNPAEVRAVRDAFARSVLWGFTAAAQTGERVLVDMNEFLLRDATGITGRLTPGSYRLEASRSALYLPMTQNFPKNTEMEVELTFSRQPEPGGRGGGGGGSFEGVGSVAANAEAASLRVHHSFVELPEPGFQPRRYDPRSGFGGFFFEDYAAPLGEPITQRFARRFRLEKRDPGGRLSDPVKPIVFYLDPGVPEPIRSALLDGARWWNQAFEAAGYRNAFQVELLPEGASSLDVRYNVINWVHRSTRGWSSGATVTDPRTGEIIKGVVTLGSLRIRQDYMLAEGLLSPYGSGTETPPELAEWALARIRQLSAHEVGHTLGLGHNYYDSEAGRISVLDYPHPLVMLKPDGSLDYSQVYEVGIGEWDSVSIAWGYQHFPTGVDENAALDSILGAAWARDIRYMTNQDVSAHPRVDQWSNGTEAAAELNRMMAVRRAALSRFGENAIKRGMPLATIEEVLVPLYLHHRYQVEAAASTLGGQHYIYAVRGDGHEPFRRATAAEQRTALQALLAALRPSELTLPKGVLDRIPPRPPGYGIHRELFPRYTGSTFDAITPAVVAAEHVFSNILDSQRAARLVEQHAVDPALPGLHDVLDELFAATFAARASANAYEAEVSRAVQRVFVDRLMELAGTAEMPQVRAIATHRLAAHAAHLANGGERPSEPESAHVAMLARDIQRFLERPGPVYAQTPTQPMPPGAPIGEPAMEFLRRWEAACSWWEGW